MQYLVTYVNIHNKGLLKCNRGIGAQGSHRGHTLKHPVHCVSGPWLDTRINKG